MILHVLFIVYNDKRLFSGLVEKKSPVIERGKGGGVIVLYWETHIPYLHADHVVHVYMFVFFIAQVLLLRVWCLFTTRRAAP